MYDMIAYRIWQTITCEVINELSRTFRINFMLSALLHRTVSLGFLPFLSFGISPICSGEWGAVLLVNVDKLTWMLAVYYSMFWEQAMSEWYASSRNLWMLWNMSLCIYVYDCMSWVSYHSIWMLSAEDKFSMMNVMLSWYVH